MVVACARDATESWACLAATPTACVHPSTMRQSTGATHAVGDALRAPTLATGARKPVCSFYLRF
jgi:hypothetical protein